MLINHKTISVDFLKNIKEWISKLLNINFFFILHKW